MRSMHCRRYAENLRKSVANKSGRPGIGTRNPSQIKEALHQREERKSNMINRSLICTCKKPRDIG